MSWQQEVVFAGGDVSLPRRARQFCDRALGDGLPASHEQMPLRNAVSLVASELTTNAVASGSSTVTVVLSVEPDHVLVSVTDDGEGMPQPKEAKLDAPDGRGLMIVGKVSREWGVTPQATGKQVWAEISLPPELIDPAATAAR